MLGASIHISYSARDYISAAEAGISDQADCVIVPGAKEYCSDTLPLILQERLNTALELYNSGKVKKILISGDEKTGEVTAMFKAIKDTVPRKDIFLDYYGYSDFNTLYRSRHVFQCKSVVIASQKLFLPRAIYYAHSFGMRAFGIDSGLQDNGRNKTADILSEPFLRVEAVFKVVTKMKANVETTYPISGSGVSTQPVGD